MEELVLWVLFPLQGRREGRSQEQRPHAGYPVEAARTPTSDKVWAKQSAGKHFPPKLSGETSQFCEH